MEVAAKEKLDAKKTRLIELLDTKMSAIEKKNLRLVEMMEQLVKEKNDQSQRLVDASKTIEDVGRRLVESERVRNELHVVNRELRSMLENVEDKGSQLAKLAKEKVLKYKTENERMQLELDGLKNGSSVDVQHPTFEVKSQDKSPTTPANGGSVDDVVRRMDEFHQQLEAALTTAKSWNPEESINTLKATLDDLGKVSTDMRTANMAFLQEVKTSAVNNDDAQKLQDKSESASSNPPAAAAADLIEKQLVSKDREIASLKDELARLKAAIGQLVGLNQSVIAASPVAPPAADVP
jgi:hypothetical protein